MTEKQFKKFFPNLDRFQKESYDFSCQITMKNLRKLIIDLDTLKEEFDKLYQIKTVNLY